jgi:ribosomal subunit interface protein
MQTINVDPPVTVTGRHMEITDAIRDYAKKKIESLHLDYPKIIEAKFVLEVQTHHRHFAEIILFCANHITIECSSTSSDLYAAMDETISKIARRMRKHKTLLSNSFASCSVSTSCKTMAAACFSKMARCAPERKVKLLPPPHRPPVLRLLRCGRCGGSFRSEGGRLCPWGLLGREFLRPVRAQGNGIV